MITESGIVLQSQDETALVRVRRGEACASCGAGCSCAGETQPQIMHVTAQNPLGAREGDHVELAITTGTLLSLSALAYLVPLAFLFLGALIGKPLVRSLGVDMDGELAAALVGFAFLAVSFLVIAFGMRRQKPGGKISPIIVKILKPEDRMEFPLGDLEDR
jgi:sigma-E factor negative regulatory protein RseC